MSDRAAFLRVICERPEEDGPRLVYADWLDEQGDPRGEFIRIQCRLVGLPETDPARPALHQRERELLSLHRDEWVREFRAGLADPDGEIEVHFVRGFVQKVTLGSVAALVLQGERLFRAAPVQFLSLSGCEDAAVLGGWEPLRRLRGLMLDGANLNGRDLEILVSSPHLTGLRRLDLRRNRLDTAAALALAGNPALAGLEALDLRFCDCESAAAAALAESPHPPHLRMLDLGTNQIGHDGVRALAESRQLSTVRVLDLHNNPIRDAGALAMLESPNLTQVSELVLYGCGISPFLRRRLERHFGARVVLE